MAWCSYKTKMYLAYEPIDCWLLSQNRCVLAYWLQNATKLSKILSARHSTLNDWSRREQWILFRENLSVSWDEVEVNIEIQGKQNSLFPKGPVIKWFVIQQNKTKAKFENPVEMHYSGQHFPGNSELFPVCRHSFRNVVHSWHLAGNSVIVRYHVTRN